MKAKRKAYTTISPRVLSTTTSGTVLSKNTCGTASLLVATLASARISIKTLMTPHF